MIYSMTGYGKSVATVKDSTFEIEVKSLNSRFLEIALRTPAALQSKEYEFRELIRKRLKRGKLFVNINFVDNGQKLSNFIFNQDKLTEAIAVLNKTKEAFQLKDEIQLSHLLTVRDLFSPDFAELEEKDFGIIKACLDDALKQLQNMKAVEGNALMKDIRERIDSIENLLGQIESEFKINLEEYLKRYVQRVQDLVKDVAFSNDRLEMEIALLTERSDIAEECVRLRSHIRLFRESLNTEDAGRKLNFVCQELNREANTMASKAISSEISHKALSMKEEVERIREQVQNIE
ncbi:MAG: YicC family protein [Ignavibacteriales bacterium]|nr:YicC family protein [Ignavibacteriales bacterium]